MKDYYQILRVRRGASAAEIRRAYRVLVQQLHPDINPNPAAHELIKEVNEAYDVLGDEAKKRDYDYRLDNPYTVVEVPQQPAHRDPRYRRTRPHVNVNRGPTQRDLMARYAPFMLKIFQTGAVMFLFLLIDFALPHREREETVASFTTSGGRKYDALYLVTQAGDQIKISASDVTLLEVDQSIKIVESRMLARLIEIQIPYDDVSITNLSTIYANFKFALWILGIFSFVGLAARGKVEFRFNLGIMTFFVLIFTVYLLMK